MKIVVIIICFIVGCAVSKQPTIIKSKLEDIKKIQEEQNKFITKYQQDINDNTLSYETKILYETNYQARELLDYAKLLTLHLDKSSEEVIHQLRKVGFTDGEILEINQLASYFNYVNRTVVGLGVALEKDNIGLSPNSSEEGDWSHQ